MGTHPNAILLAVLIPGDLVNTTFRAIVEAFAEPGSARGYVNVGGTSYMIGVMEESYDESMQISAPAGSIVVYQFLTYGYGEVMEWDKVQAQKDALGTWCEDVCPRFKCSSKIYVTANYW